MRFGYKLILTASRTSSRWSYTDGTSSTVGLRQTIAYLRLLTLFSGELRVMFAQEDTYQRYMDKFFTLNPNTAISWIHDLENGRHGAAAAALLIDAEEATNLEAKHVSLSLGVGLLLGL